MSLGDIISEIVPDLWVGGLPANNGAILGPSFRYVVSCYPWGRYDLTSERTVRCEFRLYDSPEVDVEMVEEAALLVRRWSQMGKTLVHCQQGLNRSAMVAARALVLGGMDPEAAIAVIRKNRSPDCLFNATFEAYVLGSAL